MATKVIEASDFIDIMSIKSDLICADEKHLIDYYKDVSDEEYGNVINTIDRMLDLENGVFCILTNEITDKIYKLINLKRFTIAKTHPEIFDKINEIITKLNRLNALSEQQKNYFRNSYLAHQAKIRELTYINYDSFVESLGVDAILFDYFCDDDVIDDIPYEYLIGSMFYIKKSMPGFFEQDYVLEKASELLSEMEDDEQSRISKKKIEKIKQKVLKKRLFKY